MNKELQEQARDWLAHIEITIPDVFYRHQPTAITEEDLKEAGEIRKRAVACLERKADTWTKEEITDIVEDAYFLFDDVASKLNREKELIDPCLEDCEASYCGLRDFLEDELCTKEAI